VLATTRCRSSRAEKQTCLNCGELLVTLSAAIYILPMQSNLKAILLAAGMGRRLGDSHGDLPKALLPFGGRSLLERHVDLLRREGVGEIHVTVGYGAEAMHAELERIGAEAVQTIINPRFRDGSVVSLWSAREVLASESPVLLMDADVLYDSRLLKPLLRSQHDLCFLLDRDIEPGEEPVKLCIRDGHIVDFHKRPRESHDWHGESVGFFRLSPGAAVELARRTERYVAEGRIGMEYEEPIRDMVLELPAERFGYAEVTGLPWIEIDFAEDVVRARRDILPRLAEALV
jgi:choline kinase